MYNFIFHPIHCVQCALFYAATVVGVCRTLVDTVSVDP